MLNVDYLESLLSPDDPAFESLRRSYLAAYGLGEPILSAASYGYGEIAEGGVVGGGAADVFIRHSETGSGGVMVLQPTFPNGYPCRTTVLVPAGKVAADMQFYLGVRLDVVGDVLVTDEPGNWLAHEVRDGAVYFHCDLRAAVDNLFYVYSEGI